MPLELNILKFMRDMYRLSQINWTLSFKKRVVNGNEYTYMYKQSIDPDTMKRKDIYIPRDEQSRVQAEFNEKKRLKAEKKAFLSELDHLDKHTARHIRGMIKLYQYYDFDGIDGEKKDMADKRAEIEQAELEKKLQSANPKNTNFSNANPQNTNFSNANPQNNNLSNANFSKTNSKNSDFRDANSQAKKIDMSNMELRLKSMGGDGTIYDSRSEVAIDAIMKGFGIQTVHNERLYPDNEYSQTFDYTFLFNGKKYYMEYMGKLDEDDYKEKQRKKIKLYRQRDINIHDNLILLKSFSNQLLLPELLWELMTYQIITPHQVRKFFMIGAQNPKSGKIYELAEKKKKKKEPSDIQRQTQFQLQRQIQHQLQTQTQPQMQCQQHLQTQAQTQCQLRPQTQPQMQCQLQSQTQTTSQDQNQSELKKFKKFPPNSSEF